MEKKPGGWEFFIVCSPDAIHGYIQCLIERIYTAVSTTPSRRHDNDVMKRRKRKETAEAKEKEVKRNTKSDTPHPPSSIHPVSTVPVGRRSSLLRLQIFVSFSLASSSSSHRLSLSVFSLFLTPSPLVYPCVSLHRIIFCFPSIITPFATPRASPTRPVPAIGDVLNPDPIMFDA